MAATARPTVAEVVGILEAQFGLELPDRQFEPLDELVSCILSQHSSDARTYPVFGELKLRYPDYDSLMAADLDDIEAILRPAGLARAKTQRISAALAEIRRRVGSFDLNHLAPMSDQDALAWLESLPGVGPKTAAVTLAFAFGRDVLPVDTHVFRVAKRLGWIGDKVSEARAHAILAKKTPKGLARRTHLALIRHGRTLCHARRPACDQCPLQLRCQWARGNQIGYHHSSSTEPSKPKRMSQPVAPSETFDVQRKLRCFANVSYGQAVVRAIDRSPGPNHWSEIESTPGAAERVAGLWLRAPQSLTEVFADPGLVVALIHGEVASSLELEATANPAKVVQWAHRERLIGTMQDVDQTTTVLDSLVRLGVRRLSLSIEPVVTGEWAVGTVGSTSNLRLLCFGNAATVLEESAMLRSWLDGLRRHGLTGMPIEPVAWTEEAFLKYELERMPMGERYAYVSARSLTGSVLIEKLVRKVAFALPLTPERLRDLVAMRNRETAEEMRASHRWRHVALGYGGLADVLWMVHVHELRYPTATQAGTLLNLDDRIRTLARAQLINAIERDELLEAWAHLRSVRSYLDTLGMTPDIVPENPAKLARLALAFGFDDGNKFLDYHQRVTQCVRTMVEEARERLRA